MGAITVVLSAVAAVASLLTLRKVHEMTPEMQRVSASATALLQAVDDYKTQTNAWIAELRNIVQNNTNDPDMKIQLEALANKMDEGTSRVLAGLRTNDRDGDGIQDQLDPTDDSAPVISGSGEPLGNDQTTPGANEPAPPAAGEFDPTAPAADIDPTTGQPTTASIAEGDQTPPIVGQAEGAGHETANVPPRDETAPPLGEGPAI
jgi:hypothetical protein